MAEEMRLTLECTYFKFHRLQNSYNKIGPSQLAIPSLITFISIKKPDVNTRIIIENFSTIFPIYVH